LRPGDVRRTRWKHLCNAGLADRRGRSTCLSWADDLIGVGDGGTRPLDLPRADHPAGLTDRHPVGGGELVEAAVLLAGRAGERVGDRHFRSLAALSAECVGRSMKPKGIHRPRGLAVRPSAPGAAGVVGGARLVDGGDK
jgi:hypothetical protein